MPVLLLTSEEVAENARIEDVIPAVEDAFRAYDQGTAQMPAKSYIDLSQYNGDFRSMPAYLAADEWDAAGIKWVNVHPDNPTDHGLPTVMGTMIYSDPETARPLAIMDGTVLTRKRTGAAAAIATDYLAVNDATTLGIVGAGVQSYSQVEAIAEVRPIQEITVSDHDQAQVAEFIEYFDDRFDIREGEIQDAASCDVLSTVTPVREPIISRDDVNDHTHINAIGADAEGKQELETPLTLDAKLVIDDHSQTTHSGEINVPYSSGSLTDDDIYGELGEIVTGNRAGREADDTVTVFDSTGLAIQDVAAAHVTYQTACQNDSGSEFDLLGVN
ncbi:ornithine cyclodeaminase [Natrinema pellirubrum DSM 15624]|uniref:Alanine dehydrogenase n=1 Tax=Natrinema pellirubrum (strain DSM 15624 / CIP 106293 / JCM 10476 / NCIMB 786 / 157) TaxID=797303 RepID=L0JMA5_NATP1|nr:ornithine cyclodeaminase family protein [Natrinema pellirubrum]AGB31712.1 putative ornithine cyclodeaminase, mu-crystallin [Natrinema pellirubrum DSM 15624]ELY72921.1 ornithine cyclodeaminase [Natrinema pellirubrum DSM 15624]